MQILCLIFIELSRKARPGVNIFIAELIAAFGLIFIIFGSLRMVLLQWLHPLQLILLLGTGLLHQLLLLTLRFALARTFTDTFTGINYLNTPTYIFAEILGALLALFIIQKIFKK